MKKIYKRIFALTLVLILMLSLGGCGKLDEMRSRQAIITDENTILWNGETYKKVPVGVSYSYLRPDQNYRTTLYGTAPDVPVLLSTWYYKMLDVSTDGNFLIGYWDGDAIYCKEALYEDVLARVCQPFEPDIACYTYTAYNQRTEMFEIKHHTITRAQWNALERIIRTRAPEDNQQYWWTKDHMAITVNLCSYDRFMQKNYVDICLTDEGYFLQVYEGDGVIYTVPEEYTPLMDAIMAAYREGYVYAYDIEKTIC